MVGRGSEGNVWQRYRHADDARSVANDEANRLWRRELGGHDQVTFILTALIVRDAHNLAGLDRVDRGEYGGAAEALRWDNHRSSSVEPENTSISSL